MFFWLRFNTVVIVWIGVIFACSIQWRLRVVVAITVVTSKTPPIQPPPPPPPPPPTTAILIPSGDTEIHNHHCCNKIPTPHCLVDSSKIQTADGTFIKTITTTPTETKTETETETETLTRETLTTRRKILETSASHVGLSASFLLSTSLTPATYANAVSSNIGSTTSSSSSSTTATITKNPTIGYNPISPYLEINTAGSTFSKTIQVPRVGYSLYKTSSDQVKDGVRIAFEAGVRHLDVGTHYQTNELVGTVVQEYIETGLGISGVPKNSQGRRNEIFITHKVSNTEQSTDPIKLRDAVLSAQEQLLGRSSSKKDSKILDLVMIHSPLTDKGRRLGTYSALIDMQRKGLISAVGVCNYGVNPLQEIVDNGYPPPAVIQLVLSPFNQHGDIKNWAKQHNCILSCTAWSKLSSTLGPVAGWTVLSDIAKQKGMTNAQVLIRWAIQSGYLCVPRSSAKYKIERQNIFENSWNGVSNKILTENEMNILNSLEEHYPVGKLGVTDGWDISQIKDFDWDPTTAV